MIPERVFGLSEAEQLYDSIASVWEAELDSEVEGAGEAIIEEWTLLSPLAHLPSRKRLLDWIFDWACQNGDVLEEWSFPENNNDIDRAADALLDTIAGEVTYHMVNKRVRTYLITWGEDGESPLVDGEPLYKKVIRE